MKYQQTKKKENNSNQIIITPNKNVFALTKHDLCCISLTTVPDVLSFSDYAHTEMCIMCIMVFAGIKQPILGCYEIMTGAPAATSYCQEQIKPELNAAECNKDACLPE